MPHLPTQGYIEFPPPPRDTIASPGFGLKQDLENRISWNMHMHVD